ncbi:ABC transporter substrate-binding protein [Cryptosporangium phraense]|uniref:Carbohydrate ABC transporter substrate-binding protein n=1 Tax=Cryptosporangium phraense TaxID=2593070 RepID=A0A545AFT8_9ACTN|nr:ABC transporter substrate-binding protein [Cryptosporangium phraense]TQS40197.1 carbohydrate ABC transporter substrate-binding protein [Cryptosporangium phraense]
MPTPSLDSLLSHNGVSRRSILRAAGLGAGVFAAAPLLAACTGSDSSDSGSSGTGTVTFGSNGSDEVPKKAYADLMAAAKTSENLTVKINTVAHNDFQNNINNYLKGSPDDVFTWFAGYRMKSYAKQGLVADISDIWEKAGSNFSDAFKTASTGDDGKQYFIPLYNYPWGWFYRPSVWKEKGYTEPKTWDELLTLAKKMKADGLNPIAFADKDGWPAFGTFDYLNMRINGYQFHVDLMAHKESWADPKVSKVFDTWKAIFPYQSADSLGRTWQEAAQTVVKKTSGMYLLGSFVGQQWPTGDTDIDFFEFPAVDSTIGADAIEAPIDGFMMSKKGGQNASAKKLMEYLATGKAEDVYLATDTNDVAAAKDATTDKYNALQKKAAQVIGAAKNISQFLDRDAEPAFANNAALPAFQQFIKDGDVAAVTKNLEAQAKQIYGS